MCMTFWSQYWRDWCIGRSCKMTYADIRFCVFFFSSRRRHTRYWRDWSSDVCSSDLGKQLLIDVQAFGGALGVDDARHLVWLLGVHIVEAIIVHRVGGAHRDAFRASLAEDVRAIDFLAVDLLAGEEFRDFNQLVPGLGRFEFAIVFRFEFG